jgi:hypothetical protein
MKRLFQFLFLGLVMLTITQCSVQTSENTAIKTLFVSAETRECSNGAGKMQCMLVREKPTDEWQYFYNNIDGFNYERGYDYTLTVSTVKIANPPADASSIKYTLIKQISKVKRMQ